MALLRFRVSSGKKRPAMEIKAHFDGKVIVPDEPVQLPKGKSLRVRIDVMPAAKKVIRKEKSVLDWIVENRIEDDSLPVDLSYQLDHYLYGTQKKPPPKKRRPKK
jgi:hypothetical protein